MINATPAAPARHRGVVVLGLAGFAAGSWVYLGLVATGMGDMASPLAMPMTSAWTPLQAGLMVTMWTVMMAAMMLPSAVPMVLTYDRLDRGSPQGQGGSSVLFVAGYGLVWAGFALLAAGLQWVLQAMALVDGMGEATQKGLAGAVLISAGTFQFSPMKRRSLGACRTPFGFLTTSWREGRAGALRMGFHHGSLCLRCCWAVMILLFVLGVMNLFWVASLATFVLVEKVARQGEAVSMIGGVVMIVWGARVLLGA